MMSRKLEKSLAATSFGVAASLAYIGVLLSNDHEIESGVCFVIAQFLTFAATLLGIDYKFNSAPSKPEKPKP